MFNFRIKLNLTLFVLGDTADNETSIPYDADEELQNEKALTIAT